MRGAATQMLAWMLLECSELPCCPDLLHLSAQVSECYSLDLQCRLTMLHRCTVFHDINLPIKMGVGFICVKEWVGGQGAHTALAACLVPVYALVVSVACFLVIYFVPELSFSDY